MPTTVVKTIRASGGDYTTLSAWEAANQGDLVTADEVRVAECYNDWATGLDDRLVIDGSTTDATRYLRITVAAGHRHTGVPQSGFFVKKNVGYDTLLRDSDPYTRLEWLDLENTNSNGQALYANAGSGIYSNLIAKTAGTSQYVVGLFGQNITIHGALVYGGGRGVEINSTIAANIYNSVATGCAKGFNTGSELVVLKNCVAYNNTTNYSGTFAAASTNNATSSASDDAPGASSVVGITSADFVAAAGNDYHLAAGSALIGAGVNLYADFQTDIDGDAWPSSGSWDIGFDYRVAAGGGTTHNLAADADAAASAAAALSVSVPLAAAALSVATAGGAMSVSIPLAGAAAGEATATGDLSTTGTADLAAAATAAANASGGLILSIPLAGSAVAQTLASAGITQGVPLAGDAAAVAAAAAALTLNISLAGAAIAEAAANAGLSVLTSGLAGDAVASASASAALTHAVPLSGASLAVSSASGNLTQLVPLSGAAASASMATGGLDVSVQLSAAALAQALATAGLTVDGGMSGAAAADAIAAGTLTLRVNLDGAAVAQAIASGALASDGLIVAGTPGYIVSRTARIWHVTRTPRTWKVSA